MSSRFLLFLVFTFVISLPSCKTGFADSFKLILDLKSTFNVDYVEVGWNRTALTFELRDIDNESLSIEELESLATNINVHLKKNYPKLDSLKDRKFLFSGSAGFEIIEFTFDKKGELKNTKAF
jgi:hypothetical protein